MRIVFRALPLALLFVCAGSLFAQTPVTLDQLVKEALENNPAIRAAQKGLEAARQRPAQESSLPDPMFSPSYSSNGAPWPGAGLGTEPTSNIGFMISQQLPGPGKRRLRGDIALKEAEAQSAEYETVQLNIISRLKQAFHRLHHTYVALDVMERGKDLLTRFLHVAEARYSTGKAMQQDIFKAQTQLTILETRILRMQQDRRVAEAEINSLLSRKPGSPIGIPAMVMLSPMGVTLDEIIQRAATQAPEIRREQKMVERGALAVDLARKQFRPDYAVSAGYFNMGRMPDMFQFRLDISLPLYSSRKQAPALHEQVHRLGEAKRNYEAAEQNLEFRVREAYAQAETSYQLLKLYQDTLLPQTGLTTDSSLASYETGAADFLSVLTNLMSKVDLEERYHAEMLAYWSAVIRLEEVTGLQLLK
jgi:outer membrane protein, heavy metal efflux system